MNDQLSFLKESARCWERGEMRTRLFFPRKGPWNGWGTGKELPVKDGNNPHLRRKGGYTTSRDRNHLVRTFEEL